MRNVIATIFLVFLSGIVSCNKWMDIGPEKEIVISVEDTFDATLETKASAVTSLPSSLYWGATTGGNAAGTANESAQWACESKSVSSSKISTGHYQTYSATTYNFYVSNASFTVGASTSMTVANNNTDIIVGRTAQTTSTTPSVTLNHIFARTGTLTCNTQSGYSISNVSWKITGYSSINGTAGTYNLRTQSWTATSATLGQTAITSSSDYYLIPGEYTFTVSYTLTKGDYSQSFTKSGRVTIVAGKINNISCTASGGDAQEIQFSVSITPWDTSFPAINLTAADFKPPYFSVGASTKVQFAPGNLQAVIGTGISDYRATASEWKFADHQYDFIGNAAGNNSFAVGSTVDLFGWVGASASYDSYGLCTYASANNAYYGTSGSDALKTDWGSIPGIETWIGSGWRTLTTTEWNYLFTQRANASSLYGQCQITTASGTVAGTLILPDNWTKPSNCTVTPGTGAFDSVIYSATAASGASNAWCDMEAAGAVFLPAAGYRYGDSVLFVGGGFYWSSSVNNESSAYSVIFYSGYLLPQYYYSRYYGLSVRLVCDSN